MAVALITGCSSGFGEALAVGFAENGFTVAATMRRPEAAPESVRAAATVYQLDVTDASSRSSAVNSVLSDLGSIDVLINNAGIGYFGSLEDTPEDVIRKVFETNFFGPLELTRSVLPAMRAQGSGRIIHITAIGAVLSSPFLGAYCTSKHALDAAGAIMDVETRPFGVRVSSILPAQFRTSMGANNQRAEPSDAYQVLATRLLSGFQERAAAALTDLSPVVEAALHAATSETPRSRYVVGAGSASMLDAIMPELDALKAIEDARAGHE